MAAAPPEDLVKAIAEGRALIVCGAGVTRLATDNKAPGWAHLIEMGLDAARPTGGSDPAWVRACRERLKPDASEKDWLKVADDIQEQLGGSADGRYRAFLKAAVGELSVTKRAVIDALRTLAAARNPVSTTNYDSVLCDEIGCRVISWTNPDGAADCLEGDRKAILHLHGHWDEPGSVIFSARDYERVKGAESTQFLQQLATHTRTLVFVGCSASGLGDENVGSLLKWFGTRWAGRGKKHYVLVHEAGRAAPWPTAVTPIVYGNGFRRAPRLPGLARAYASAGCGDGIGVTHAVSAKPEYDRATRTA